jgi:hypothetical protein
MEEFILVQDMNALDVRMLSLTLQPLYPRGRSRQYPLNRRFSVPQSRSGGFGEHNFLTLLEIELRTVQLVARSLHRLCAVLCILSTSLFEVVLYCIFGLSFKIKVFCDMQLRIHHFSTWYCSDVKSKRMRRVGHVSRVREGLSDNWM